MPDFKIKISADTQQFGAAIGKSVNELNNFASTAASRLGALFGAGGLARYAKQTIDFASRFNDSAKKLGVGVEFLQEAAFAAKQTGAQMSDVEQALKRLQIAQVAALGGKQDALGAFGRLGVSKEALQNSSVETLFKTIAENVHKAQPSAQQLSDTIELMGRSADSLLPAFREGFNDLQKVFQDAGLALDRELVEKLDSAGDRLEFFGLRIRRTFAPVVGWLTEMGQRFADFADLTVGGAARFGGALWGGASLKDARAEFQRFHDEVLDRAKQRMDGPGAAASGKGPGPVQDVEAAQKRIGDAEAMRVQNAAALANFKFQELSAAQKLAAITAFQVGLEKQIAAEKDPVRKQLLARAGLGAIGDLQGLRNPMSTPLGFPAADSAARVGLFSVRDTGIYSEANNLQRLAVQKLDKVELAVRSLERTVRGLL